MWIEKEGARFAGFPSFLLWFAVAFGLLCSSCGPSVHVATAFDPGAKKKQYRTFAMLEPNRPVHSESTTIDPFTLQRLRQLVYLGLKERGLNPAKKEEADLLVAAIATKDRRTVVYQTGPYAYDSLYGPPVWSYNQYVSQVDEGIVVVDLIDRDRKSVIWRGTGAKSLSSSRFSEVELGEMVSAILAEYPPGQPAP